jgi:hypothetical protein
VAVLAAVTTVACAAAHDATKHDDTRPPAAVCLRLRDLQRGPCPMAELHVAIDPGGRVGDVAGEGPMAAPGVGMPGWLELPAGTFFPDTTARAPTPPWLPGIQDSNGFRPSTRALSR